MAWVNITGTNLQYNTDAYNNLSQNRKDFWDKQNVSISNGIRTDLSNGIEIYMQIRKLNDNTIIYKESELNKTYFDNK
jgi:hypothetical protein